MCQLLDPVVDSKEAVFFQRRKPHRVIRIQYEMGERGRREKRAEVEEGEVEVQDNDEDLTKEIMLMLNVLSLSESAAKDMVQLLIEKKSTRGTSTLSSLHPSLQMCLLRGTASSQSARTPTIQKTWRESS